MSFLTSDGNSDTDKHGQLIDQVHRPMYQRTTVDFLHRQERIQPGETEQLARISRFEADSIESFAVQTDQTNAKVLIMLGEETYTIDLSAYDTHPIASTKAWFGVINWDDTNTHYVIGHEEPIPFNEAVHELRIGVKVPNGGSVTNVDVYMKVKKYA